MSLLSIFIKGFSGLGEASTVPLSFAFNSETFYFVSRDRSAPPESNKPVHQSNQQMDRMVQMAKKEIGEVTHKVEIGCFAATEGQKPLWKETLYVCTDLGSAKPVAFWFYYSGGRRFNVDRGAYQITKITKKDNYRVTMHLKNETRELTADLTDKLRQWASGAFDPKKCNITKSEDIYTTTCGSSNKPFEQKVHRKNFYTTQTPSLNQ